MESWEEIVSYDEQIDMPLDADAVRNQERMEKAQRTSGVPRLELEKPDVMGEHPVTDTEDDQGMLDPWWAFRSVDMWRKFDQVLSSSSLFLLLFPGTFPITIFIKFFLFFPIRSLFFAVRCFISVLKSLNTFSAPIDLDQPLTFKFCFL